MNEGLYRRLQVVAKRRSTTYYSTLGEAWYLYVENAYERSRLSTLLQEIDTHEHHHGRPLLSVVVVSFHAGLPGPKFFQHACLLGRMRGRDDDEAFFRSELERVYSFWAESPYLRVDGTPYKVTERKRSSVVGAEEMINSGSKVTLRNLKEGDEMVYTLVEPGKGDPSHGEISIESPLGSALVGKTVGVSISVQVPSGELHLRIERVGKVVSRSDRRMS